MKLASLILKNFTLTIAIFTVFAIVFGFGDLVNFYFYFDIDITEYISGTEIIMLSIGKIIHFGFISFIPFLMVYKFIKQIALYQIRYPFPLTFKWLFTKKIKIYSFICVGLTIISFVLSMNLETEIVSFDFFVNLGCFFILLSLAPILSIISFISLNDKFANSNEYRLELIAITNNLAFFAFLFMAQNVVRPQQIKASYNNPTPMTFFINDSTKVSTNDSIRYVGKTNTYSFLYNIKSNSAIIYPNVIIQKIILHNKPKGNIITEFIFSE